MSSNDKMVSVPRRKIEAHVRELELTQSGEMSSVAVLEFLRTILAQPVKSKLDAYIPASANPSAPEVRLVSYAEDMSTCTLTNGDGNGYFYDRVEGEPVERDERRAFCIGDMVRKKSGSEWEGKVVGTYSTALTSEGYCVESSSHAGSVQIYPASALERKP